jgi:hypothetical protein
MSGNGCWTDTFCGEIRHFSCRHRQNRDDWRVTAVASEWERGAVQCASEYPDYRFDVPLTGYENQKLADAAQGQSVWLNLNDRAVEGVWRSTEPQTVSGPSGRASTTVVDQLGEEILLFRGNYHCSTRFTQGGRTVT